MAGTKWLSVEVEIIIRYDRLGYQDKFLCTALQQEARTSRSLAAVRSKLAELRRNPAAYDSILQVWIDEGVRHMIKQMQEEEEEEEK
jgi:hypothetical protein